MCKVRSNTHPVSILPYTHPVSILPQAPHAPHMHVRIWCQGVQSQASISAGACCAKPTVSTSACTSVADLLGDADSEEQVVWLGASLGKMANSEDAGSQFRSRSLGFFVLARVGSLPPVTALSSAAETWPSPSVSSASFILSVFLSTRLKKRVTRTEKTDETSRKKMGPTRSGMPV